MHFEVHITVETNNVTQFIKDCEEFGCKPIVIETQREEKTGIQVMTSDKFNGDSYEIYLKNIVNFFEYRGYKILRKKIEILPEQTKHKDFIYYESHFRLKLPKNIVPVVLSLLKSHCKTFNWHYSKNLFKTSSEFDYQMITRRDYGMSLEVFKAVDIEGMKGCLDGLGIEYDKIEIEECIYDSNVSVDKEWLNAKRATIFGGGRTTKKPTREYLDTIEIGWKLASYGYEVKTGGYGGIMEAASKGCREYGGVALGYTCKTFPSTIGNQYLTNTIVAEDIFERLRMLISETDLFIVQKGGLGTLAELFLTLDICRKMQNPPKIILVGEHWYDIMEPIEPTLSAKEYHLYEIIDSVDALNLHKI
jgi:uncharacterized protein (TIGR00730 family)